MFRYLRLRIPQLLLIISVALPLALIFSFRVTSSGMIDTSTFMMVFTGCTAVMWGGLALYTRAIGLCRTSDVEPEKVALSVV